MASQVFLYQHLPKCGGISFIRACSQWFPSFRERTGSYPTPEQTAAFAKQRYDFTSLPEKAFVHGHLVRPGIRPFERYGEELASGRAAVLTIVRDPLERGISAYYHRRRIGKDWDEPLDLWLRRGRNVMSRYLDVTAETWRERLDRYLLVGVTEHLQLTLDVFAGLSGQSRLTIERLNTSPRDGETVSEDFAEWFRKKNPLDYEIYAYAKERLQREAAANGLS